MGSLYGPPFGLPKRINPLPDQGFQTVECDKPDEERLPHELYPWIFPPPGYESFDPTGVIATPVAAGENTVLELKAPIGWDGIILRIANIFQGPGFIDGSGNLIWRILINGTPVKNYGRITTTIGTYSPAGYGYGIREISGIILHSGDTAVYSVNNSNAGLAGGTSIVCIFGGYFWRHQGGTF